MLWFGLQVAGLEPGPDGAGWQLLDRLTAHVTQPQFVHRHHWEQGDCVVYDNRRLVHAGSWFDKTAQVSFQWKNPDFLLKNPDFLLKNPDFVTKQRREMWRTTVRGKPGAYYADRPPSWLATADPGAKATL